MEPIELTKKFIEASANEIHEQLIQTKSIVVCAITYQENGKAGVIIPNNIQPKELESCIQLLQEYKANIVLIANGQGNLIEELG